MRYRDLVTAAESLTVGTALAGRGLGTSSLQTTAEILPYFVRPAPELPDADVTECPNYRW